MLMKVFIALAVVLGGFLTYVAVQPTQMMVARELVVNASPQTIFPHINHSKKANAWMPWQDSDPEATMTYSGPEEGVGSKSSWNSKGKMGTGEALVTESIVNQVVKTKLTYTKPFQMSQLAEMSLTPATGGTSVKWAVSGHNNFFFRMIGVFMDCDKMIGSEFEKGLLKLKNIVEREETTK